MHLDDTGLTATGQAAGPIAAAWEAFAPGLAAHFFALQNRSDVLGRYVPLGRRKPHPKTGRTIVAYTAHAVLLVGILMRHFVGRCRGDLVGLHLSSPAETCRWVVIDLDAHGAGDDPEANWRMALAVYLAAKALAFDVMLLDSDGRGGFHLWIIFARSVPMADAWRLGRWLVRDFASFGLARPPETLPDRPRLAGKRIGRFIRLPGLHHTRDHWTRVRGGECWLEGRRAIEAILAVTGKDVDLAAVIPPDFEPRKNVTPNRRPGVTPVLSVNPADRRSNIGMGLAPEPSERRIATVREALGHLGDELRGDYAGWIKVGLMLRELGEPGLELWHRWARACPNYEPGALDAKWASFGSGDGGQLDDPITLGSLFYLAKRAGWPGPSAIKAKRGIRGTFTTPVRPLDPGKEAHR